MGTFAFRKIPVVPLAGRFKHFIDNREVLTYEQNILSVIKGYRIPFQSQPVKQKILWEKNFQKLRRFKKCLKSLESEKYNILDISSEEIYF